MTVFKYANLPKFILNFAEIYHQAKIRATRESQASTLYIKYKINSSYEEYQKTGKLLVQSKKGGAYVYMSPSEICSDESIISQLHPIDVSVVTKLQLESGERTENHRIIKRWYCEERSEEIYLLYDTANEISLELSETDILDSYHIINRLTAKDCMSIGFDLGVKHRKHYVDVAEAPE